MRTDLKFLGHIKGCRCHFSQELLLTSTLPGSYSNHHFIKNYPNWKYIAFWRVNIPHKWLDGHVQRSSHVMSCLYLTTTINRKSKISQFPWFGVFKDVCWLNISVDYSHFKQIFDSLYNFTDDKDCLFFT